MSVKPKKMDLLGNRWMYGNAYMILFNEQKLIDGRVIYDALVEYDDDIWVSRWERLIAENGMKSYMCFPMFQASTESGIGVIVGLN